MTPKITARSQAPISLWAMEKPLHAKNCIQGTFLLAILLFCLCFWSCTPPQKHTKPHSYGHKPRPNPNTRKTIQKEAIAKQDITPAQKLLGNWFLDTLYQGDKVIPSSILGTNYSLDFRKDFLCSSKQSGEEKLFRYSLQSQVIEMVGLNGLEKWRANIITLNENQLNLTLLDEKQPLTSLKFIRRAW